MRHKILTSYSHMTRCWLAGRSICTIMLVIPYQTNWMWVCLIHSFTYTGKKTTWNYLIYNTGRIASAIPWQTRCWQWNSLREANILTHWGRVTHIFVGNLTIIGSDNGLSPGRRQAIIETNAGILSIGPLGRSFNEISIGIQTFSFKKMHLNMSSAKWRPFCPGLNELTY